MSCAASLENGRHGRTLACALSRLARFVVLYPLTLVSGALLLWLGVGVLNAAPASTVAPSPASRSSESAAYGGIKLAAGDKNNSPTRAARNGDSGSRPTSAGSPGSGDRHGNHVARQNGRPTVVEPTVRERRESRSRPSAQASAPARRSAAARADQPTSRPARPASNRPAANRPGANRPAADRSAAPRTKAGCGWHAPLVSDAVHCTSTSTSARGKAVTEQCVGKRTTGCTVSTHVGAGRTRVQSGCDPGRNRGRGGCSASERTRSGASRTGFTGSSGTTHSTADRGSRCTGTNCAADRRAPGRPGSSVKAEVGCGVGPCTVRAGHTGQLRCTPNCRATAREEGRLTVPPRTTTASATCRGNCEVRANPRAVTCTKSRQGDSCVGTARTADVSGAMFGSAKSVCRGRDAGQCTARASVTGSASCTSHGPQCRTRALSTDPRGGTTARELTSDARCAEHRAGRCSAVSRPAGQPSGPTIGPAGGVSTGPASACRGLDGRTFCRTTASAPAGETTGACRQTNGRCRATSAVEAASRCTGQGSVSTCETSAAAPRGRPMMAYCHSIGAGRCVDESSVGGGSTCSAGGRHVYCNTLSPQSKPADAHCSGQGFYDCRTRADAESASLLTTCAGASSTVGRRARCATSSTGRSVEGSAPVPPVRPTPATGAVPAAVVADLVPGYEPAGGPPTAAQQEQARAELHRVQGRYQGSIRQLDRLDREGAAVDAMANVLRTRGHASPREAGRIAVANADFRRKLARQQARLTEADGTLADVARHAAQTQTPTGSTPRDPSRPDSASESDRRAGPRPVSAHPNKLFADPWPPAPVVVGVTIDALGNYRRATGTYQDAADRHRAKSMRLAAQGKQLQAVRQLRLANRYQRMSDRLDEITRQRSPLKHVPDVIQRALAAAPGDALPKSNPAMRTVRRAATKVGWASVAGLAVDVGTATGRGESVPRAAAKGGSTVAASSVAGGLTAAGIAATVPGPGWAVAGGIVVGTGVAWVMTESGAADWVGDKIVSIFD